MTVRAALSDCIAYLRLFPSGFSSPELTRPVELPDEGTPWTWRPVLNASPTACALRSGRLTSAAQCLTDEFHSWRQQDEERFLGFIRTRRAAIEQVMEEDVHSAETELARSWPLLAVDPAASLFDGAAWVASNGYVDENGVPPWDTWLLTLPAVPNRSGGRLLVCWVPAWAKAFVNAGIDVDPASCLSWASVEGGTVQLYGWGRRLEMR